MKKINHEKAMEINGGRGHYHWICRDGENFTSKAYKTAGGAGKAMQNHINKYPAHAKDCEVFYCEKSSCKW